MSNINNTELKKIEYEGSLVADQLPTGPINSSVTVYPGGEVSKRTDMIGSIFTLGKYSGHYVNTARLVCNKENAPPKDFDIQVKIKSLNYGYPYVYTRITFN
jgi:hypothetical protein